MSLVGRVDDVVISADEVVQRAEQAGDVGGEVRVARVAHEAAGRVERSARALEVGLERSQSRADRGHAAPPGL